MIDDGIPNVESDFPMAPNDLGVALVAHDVGLLRSLNICFPACIYSYDRSTHTAEVMPLIKQGFYNGKWNYIRRKVFKVTVRNIQCGGFTIDIPVYVGDTGWVFSSDRDTQFLKQTGALTTSVLEKDRPIAIVEDDYQQDPATHALHSLIHGVFIPDNWGEWAHSKYKDMPAAALGSSLYIGSSIDTNDNKNDTETTVYTSDNKSHTIKKEYQKGDGYEQKTTSSIVLHHNGGVSMASSSDKETDQNAHVTVEKKQTEMEVMDNKEHVSSALILDAADGILIRQDKEAQTSSESSSEEGKHFICSIQPGRLQIRMTDKSNRLDFLFEDGKLNVFSSGDVNMKVGGDTSFRCQGDVNVVGEKDMYVHAEGNVNVRSGKDALVSAENARVVAENDASVTARQVSATAAETANVNAGKTVNIGAVETTNINAGQTVNITGGRVNLEGEVKINGHIITPSSHDENSGANYWAWEGS